MLEVLFAKAGDVRLDEIEEFADDGGNTTEMTRTAGAFQHGGQPGNINVSLAVGALRVNFRWRRREHEIHFAFVQLFAIFLQRSWVAYQIVRAVKLHWVHENTDHHDVSARFRFLNQFHMTIVQVAHRWHQRNAFTVLAQAANMLSQQRQGFNN